MISPHEIGPAILAMTLISIGLKGYILRCLLLESDEGGNDLP